MAVATTPPPPFLRFDACSEYRVYASVDVPPGTLRVTVANRHLSDGLVFEQWRSSAGATFAQNISANGRIITDEALDFLQRIVWVGHHDEQPNLTLGGPTGWRLDFIRFG